jgi:hypothetical protein
VFPVRYGLGLYIRAGRILNDDTRWRSVVNFTPRERAPGTRLIGGSVIPRSQSGQGGGKKESLASIEEIQSLKA